MAESSQHLDLVKTVRNTVCKREDVVSSLVEAEDHEENVVVHFSTPEGYRPDVYYNDEDLLIIGEAKTPSDLFSSHSEAQFDSYLKYLQGEANIKKVFLYVGVPWTEFKRAKNRFRKIKPSSVDIMVVCDLGYTEGV